MDLTLGQHLHERYAVVEVSGEVDVHSAPQLRDHLVELLDADNKPLVVDLAGVTFLDSTGLGALVAALNRANELEVGLALVCSTERILRLFRITGLDQVFTIYTTVDQAVRSVVPAGE